jgi:hypothetical protein
METLAVYLLNSTLKVSAPSILSFDSKIILEGPS